MIYIIMEKNNLWPDFPHNYELADDCMCSFTCLSWILVQACQASVGMDVDGKSCFIGDINWWLTPTPSNNLMKCNPKYPSVKQL